MKDASDIHGIMKEIGQKAKAASAELAFASAEVKTTALNAAADAVWARRGEILTANAKDMEFGREKGLSPAMLDRLELNEDRIQSIVDGLRAVAADALRGVPVGAESAYVPGVHSPGRRRRHGARADDADGSGSGAKARGAPAGAV